MKTIYDAANPAVRTTHKNIRVYSTRLHRFHRPYVRHIGMTIRVRLAMYDQHENVKKTLTFSNEHGDAQEYCARYELAETDTMYTTYVLWL